MEAALDFVVTQLEDRQEEIFNRLSRYLPDSTPTAEAADAQLRLAALALHGQGHECMANGGCNVDTEAWHDAAKRAIKLYAEARHAERSTRVAA